MNNNLLVHSTGSQSVKSYSNDITNKQIGTLLQLQHVTIKCQKSKETQDLTCASS